MKIQVRGTILPSHGSAGTVCVKEMASRDRTNPKYGMVLWLIQGVHYRDLFYVPDTKDQHEIERMRAEGKDPEGKLKEVRVILEMSVQYSYPPEQDRLKDLSWDSLIPYLADSDKAVGKLRLRSDYLITLPFPLVQTSNYLTAHGRYESGEEVSRRLTRVSSGGNIRSLVLKCDAGESTIDSAQDNNKDRVLISPSRTKFLLVGQESITEALIPR